MNKTVLIIDDDSSFLLALKDFLITKGYTVSATTNPLEGLRLFTEARFHVVLLDYQMPEMSGVDLVLKLREIDRNAQFIMMTAYPDLKSAIRLIKGGLLYDYLIKPIDLVDIDNILNHVFNELKFEKLQKAKAIVHNNMDDVIPETAYFKEIKSFIKLAASNSLPVLITGETGTGKNFIARLIHKMSGRDSFITVNCAAVPEGIFESELFGVEKGAFTGAQTKEGLFEIADGGTLFLDEIGEMPINLQAKILDAIDSLKIRRVGGRRFIPVDVRIIAATNSEPERMIQEGKFRRDLFYRLNVLHFHLKPLRQRRDDIIRLAEIFISRFHNERITLSHEEKKMLVNYQWPGNIRELKNVIERSHILAQHYGISLGEAIASTLGEKSTPHQRENYESLEQEIKPISIIEKETIEKALRYFNGNKTKTAKALGISLSTLKRKIKRYKIQTNSD